ncbi:cysteine desulfurase family protein [Alteromonas oceani]|jgi:cysteine desulfurase|uniref:cysteine desulfurase n=1 Tax=Alteromonas oceani TaxID=2071609 RepID=A0ABV7JWJ0_9ALTE|nr:MULTISPECIES: cysteine desulfurase family protein [Alteromonas]MBI56345.1 aminotransferase [Alcanivorax sp.]|tara:strand:+ start:1537 stop:2634 length:1098 start_codon:yes stop_codon:yes gene_type:complete
MLYFDSAGSFPLLDAAKKALIDELSNSANPSSDHECGLQAAQKVENVREEIADTIGAYPSEIIFTSGATESNNLALKSILNVNQQKRHIITSKTEHKCILSICSYLEQQGFQVTYLSPNKDGIIEQEAVRNTITDNTALVSIMHVNNELGTINPIREIGKICFDYNVPFHTDAAQSFGKLDIDVDDLNIDFMSISAHKIGGPKGIGAIYVREARNKNIVPVIHGAGQEMGLRGGTLPSPLIVSFGKALSTFPTLYTKHNFLSLKKCLREELIRQEIPFIENGADTLPHILSLTFPTIDITTFIQRTSDLFCIAQGSACSSKEVEPSHVLRSISLNRDLAQRTIRLSLDFESTPSSLMKFAEELGR